MEISPVFLEIERKGGSGMLCITEKGYFRTRSAFSEDITPRRRVGSFEVEIVATGTGFSYIDGVRYSHVPNRLIFAKPGSQRFTIGAYECDYLKFTCDEEASSLLRTLPDSAILTDPTVKGAMEAICRLPKHPDAAEYFSQQAALSALLSRIAACLRHEPFQPRDTDPHFPAVLRAKEYLDAHFGEKISLEQLAGMAHLSKNFFRGKYQALMGISPHAYLEQVRLAYAQNLLRTTAMPLSQIAAACGYDSQSYMNYVFRRQTGRTPLNYRRSGQID